MKILIGSGNYPKLSESYIEAEIQYLLRRGLEVAVYSPVAGSPEAPEIVRVYRDHEKALREYKPDVFHVHYLTFNRNVIEAAGKLRIPVTVRGHSFDFSVDNAKRMADLHAIKKVWLFPHFSERVQHRKVDPLPVAFDSTLYRPVTSKDRRSVYRTGAGKHGKGLQDFFEVASLCPEFKFSLSANIVLGEESYLGVLKELASKSPVEYVTNIQRGEAASRMASAGIYLDTSDPRSHPFGMPISIAEAMATGAYVLARKNESVGAYLGAAGALYESTAEAASLIRKTLEWKDSDWTEMSSKAVKQAALFSDEAVLGNEVLFWQRLCT